MKILLRLGDNDFYFTMMAFGRLFTQDHRKDVDRVLTVERVVQLWNEMCGPLYLLAQNQWSYRDTPEDYAHTRKYLQITKDRVLLGEDAVKYMNENRSGWNGEWLFVDTETKIVETV